jgi:heme O synthase-like polyprenyltransferase
MLTVTHGRRATRAHILVYTVLLVPVALGLALHLDRRAGLRWRSRWR